MALNTITLTPSNHIGGVMISVLASSAVDWSGQTQKFYYTPAPLFYLCPFDICSLSYNLFALMHQLLPLEFANKRAKYIRHRLYAIAAKAIKTGRKVIN